MNSALLKKARVLATLAVPQMACCQGALDLRDQAVLVPSPITEIKTWTPAMKRQGDRTCLCRSKRSHGGQAFVDVVTGSPMSAGTGNTTRAA